MRASLTLGFCLLTATVAAAQTPRDSRAAVASTGTATISGKLISDEPTPQPIARAKVALTAEGQPALTAYTDAAGAFSFSSVLAGRYSLEATKPAYVRAAYGAKRPGRPGTAIMVANDQHVANIQLKMARGAVITGTVRDELGQPAPGAMVRALQYRFQNGERTLAPVPLTMAPATETTDDRGSYRIYGLPAGEYIVSATPRPMGGTDIRQVTPADFQAAQRAAQSRTSNAAAVNQAPDPVTVTYSQVFFPGTTTSANATPITLGAGEERGGIDLSLPLVRTARIEGTVSAPGGSPSAAVDVLMVPNTVLGLAGGLSFNRVRTDAEGRFSFSGVAPGRYSLRVRVPTSGFWASSELNVDGENVRGLRLDLAPPLSVSGRVVTDVSGTPPDFSTARLLLQPMDGGTVVVTFTGPPAEAVRLGIGGGQVDGDGRFTLRNVSPGKYRLNAQLAVAGVSWRLKSAVARGRNVLDFPFEIEPGEHIDDAVLTLTSQTQEVSGTLQDATGRPAPDFTVVVFPADKALWSATRRIKTARPATDGRFLFRDLPAGDYRIAALVDIAPGEEYDPSLLDELVPASIVFSLKDGERKVQDIRIAR